MSYNITTAGFALVLQQQPPSQMGQQDSLDVVTEASCATDSQQVSSSLSEVSLSLIIYVLMVFSSYFQFLMQLQSTLVGAKSFGFALLQPFGAYQ